MPEWIDVRVKLPPITGYMDGSTDYVLVYFGTAYYQPTILIASGDFSEDGFSWFLYGKPYCTSDKPTHWMPLPEKPKI